MKTRRQSLLSTLLKSMILPGVMAAVIGVLIVHNLVKEEYDELLDSSLTGKAQLLLTIFDAARQMPDLLDISMLMAFEERSVEPDERTVFWFLDETDQIIVQSPGAQADLLPTHMSEGLRTQNDHRFATIRAASGGVTVIVATPMTERNEAISDVMMGTISSFVLLALFFAGVAFWVVKRSVRAIASLSDSIAAKNEHDLSPIERHITFSEIEPAIDTLDMLMARLDLALAAERAFATNAAHELRTPVAICLANVQRLRAVLKEPVPSASVAEIEQGLKRLIRLIERLLQMSRAQSGLGVTPVAADITPVIALLLKELRDRAPSGDNLIIQAPDRPWPSRIDPDALGIILNNLFDNALKYGTGPLPVVVDASQPGRVVVSNDCAALDATDLEAITQRFVRKAALSEGFGLGLSIVQALCQQSGCRLEVMSPQPGQQRGFAAVLTLPLCDAPAR